MSKFLASSKFAAALAILAPFAGAVIAFRKDAIIHGLALKFPNATYPFDWGVDFIIIAALFFAFVVGFSLHKKAESDVTKDRQSELKRNIDSLSSTTGVVRSNQDTLNQEIVALKGHVDRFGTELDVVATFGLHRLAGQYMECISLAYPAALASLDEKADRKDLVLAINTILLQIQILVASLDAQPPETEYTCSVFLFHSADQLRLIPELERNSCPLLKKDSVFGEPVDFKQLVGILELRKELGQGDRVHEDPFILTVRDPSLLPGAPQAVVTRRPDIKPDIASIRAWCDTQFEAVKDFTPNQVAKIMDNFERGHVKSFVAMPLQSLSPGNEMLGVLMIERSSPGILAGTREAVFYALTLPLKLFLAELMLKYKVALTKVV